MASTVIFLICILWISTIINCLVINARVVVNSPRHLSVFLHSNISNIVIEDKEASFGSKIQSAGIRGLLVVSRPINACTPVFPIPKIFPYNYRYFFALIEESNCEYSHQALMVQNAGYTAAIIYRRTSENLIVMKGGEDADRINIPCVNIARASGSVLKRYDFTTNTEIELLPSVNVPIELYLIPFLVVFGVCFLFMAIFSIARYCRYRAHLHNSRLSKGNLKCIPTKKFKKGDEYDICAICLEEFEIGDKLRILPCSHVYHCKCVDPWLTGGKKSCPVCNRPVSVSKNPKSKRVRSTRSTSSTNNEQQAENESPNHEQANERTPLLSSESDRNSPPAPAVNV